MGNLKITVMLLSGNTIMLFVLEEVKETIFDFSEGTIIALWVNFINLFYFYIRSI